MTLIPALFNRSEHHHPLSVSPLPLAQPMVDLANLHLSSLCSLWFFFPLCSHPLQAIVILSERRRARNQRDQSLPFSVSPLFFALLVSLLSTFYLLQAPPFIYISIWISFQFKMPDQRCFVISFVLLVIQCQLSSPSLFDVTALPAPLNLLSSIHKQDSIQSSQLLYPVILCEYIWWIFASPAFCSLANQSKSVPANSLPFTTCICMTGKGIQVQNWLARVHFATLASQRLCPLIYLFFRRILHISYFSARIHGIPATSNAGSWKYN